MNANDRRRLTEQGVSEEIQSNPHVFAKLAENALTVAESLRDNYFKNTADFIAKLRQAIYAYESKQRSKPIIDVKSVENIDWKDIQNEVVTFIDGGLGQVQISSQVPILLRVGSYCVKTGEQNISEREKFGYYPVILGDIEGGSKERKDFPDIVRIIAELLGGLSALERTPDLKLLMFHGPLVYLMNAYAGHTPFTEADINLFLSHYSNDGKIADKIKAEFLEEARLKIYPRIVPERADEWIDQKLFEPLCWISFLYRRLINEASLRDPKTIIVGVVERGQLREFSEKILLERVFVGLREKNNIDYFNQVYGRTDLKSPKTLLDRLAYTDGLLLAMILEQGQYSEPWIINKYGGLGRGNISLPGESFSSSADWSPLKPGSEISFPEVLGCYINVSETTEPIRVEVFSALGPDQLKDAIARTFLYARLLPGYGFPVGLDIVDKYAHIPSWMTEAYGKQIKYQLGVSLQNGEIDDAEMRKIIIQSIYMTKRDWLFRPQT